MAARVTSIGDLSSSAWAGKKPKNYKGADLDKALKAWDALAAKPVKFPPDLIPAAPEGTLSKIEGCAVMVQAAIKEIDKLGADLEVRIKALKAVSAAAGKTNAELMKLSQDKKLKPDEVKEYRSAAIEAGTLGSSASFFAEREFA